MVTIEIIFFYLYTKQPRLETLNVECTFFIPSIYMRNLLKQKISANDVQANVHYLDIIGSERFRGESQR